MTSPQRPTPTPKLAEAGRLLLTFLLRHPARHRAVAATALALVAMIAIGGACTPLRLQALVVSSLITALLVLSDLFVPPDRMDRVRGGAGTKPLEPFPAHQAAFEGWPFDSDPPLPSCPACGLPVFDRPDGAPAHFFGLSWQGGDAAAPILFPFVTARMHANDDADPQERCPPGAHGIGQSPDGAEIPCADVAGLAHRFAAPAAREGAASSAADAKPGCIPEMAAGEAPWALAAPVASYAGSRPKMALDMLGAGALLVGLGPLMFAIALVLAILGGFPVLVHQERLDWSGRRFRVSRFRSRNDRGDRACGRAPPISGFHAGLPSASRFEAFLHRSGLACLPLLVSILRGDLSFVGPDPAMPDISRRDRVGAALVAESASRLGARPGLTGWAEVNRGAERDLVIAARQKIACDLYYLEHSSPLLDLRILARALDAFASGGRAS